MHDFILSNKFEYGYNPVGGRHLAAGLQNQEKKVEKNEIKKIVNENPEQNAQCKVNKANDAR